MTVHSRPAFESVDSSVDSQTSVDQSRINYCYRNTDQFGPRCGRPGNTTIPQVFDDGYFYDTWETCPEIKCCYPEAGKTASNRCKCAGYLKYYNKPPFTTTDKCCSLSYNNANICGCGKNEEGLRVGGVAADCCSGYLDKNRKCQLQSCTKAGFSPKKEKPCCRSMLASDDKNTDPWLREYNSSKLSNGECGCFHFNTRPADVVDDVGGNNCCNGVLNGPGGTCGCISTSDTPLIQGAVESDCCEKKAVKTDGKMYCKASKCMGPGEKSQGGVTCCSGIKGKENVCGCLAPGKTIPTGQTAERTCCSGKADHAAKEKCGHSLVGDKINKNLTDASVCSSGKLVNGTTCACIHAGDVDSSHPVSQCCSKSHDKDKKCGCLLHPSQLEDGAKPTDCCHGFRGRKCLCGAPGRPSIAGLDGKDCCSNSSKGGHCGCFGPKAVIAESQAPQCCGGFYNRSSAKCDCVLAETAVGSFVHDGACCDGKNDGGKCVVK